MRIKDCPDKTHDDYNTQMQNLHDNDSPKYNACLSQVLEQIQVK